MDKHYQVYKIVFEICQAMATHRKLHPLFYQEDDKNVTLFSCLMNHRKKAKVAQKMQKNAEKMADEKPQPNKPNKGRRK